MRTGIHLRRLEQSAVQRCLLTGGGPFVGDGSDLRSRAATHISVVSFRHREKKEGGGEGYGMLNKQGLCRYVSPEIRYVYSK